MEDCNMSLPDQTDEPLKKRAKFCHNDDPKQTNTKQEHGIIVSETKTFSYTIDEIVSQHKFPKICQSYYCYDCKCRIEAIIFSTSERNYGNLYSHLEKHHGVICFESTVDNSTNKTTQLTYKKVITIK